MAWTEQTSLAPGVVPTTHHGESRELPVMKLAPVSMEGEGGLPTSASCASWSLLSPPCAELLPSVSESGSGPRGQHLLAFADSPSPSVSQHFDLLP